MNGRNAIGSFKGLQRWPFWEWVVLRRGRIGWLLGWDGEMGWRLCRG